MTREVNDTGHTPSKGSRTAPYLKAERFAKPNRATLALQRRPHNSDAAKRAQEFIRRAREAPMI